MLRRHYVECRVSLGKLPKRFLALPVVGAERQRVHLTDWQ